MYQMEISPYLYIWEADRKYFFIVGIEYIKYLHFLNSIVTSQDYWNIPTKEKRD